MINLNAQGTEAVFLRRKDNEKNDQFTANKLFRKQVGFQTFVGCHKGVCFSDCWWWDIPELGGGWVRKKLANQTVLWCVCSIASEGSSCRMLSGRSTAHVFLLLLLGSLITLSLTVALWWRWSVLFCTLLCWSVLFCTLLCWSVLFCTLLCWSVLFCTLLCWSVLFCTLLCWSVLFCTLLYWSVLFCTLLCWSVLLCTLLC